MSQFEFDFIDDIPPICGCGCNLPVGRSKLKPYGWNTYIFGHMSKDKKRRAILSKAGKERWRNPIFRAKHTEINIKRTQSKEFRKYTSQRMKQLCQTPEHRIVASEASKRNWENPEYRRKVTKTNRTRTQSKKFREHMSQVMRKRWEDPDERKRLTAINKENAQNPETRAKLSIAIKAKWQEPDYRARIMVSLKEQAQTPASRAIMSQQAIEQWKNPNFRKLMSDKGKARWQDPEMVEKILNGRGKSPNNLEVDFDEATPDQVRYTGDGTWWRQLPNGKHKNPDFKITGMNQVIELFGDYWHRNDDPEELIKLYADVGIECLVIWESEWNTDRENVLIRVNEFIGSTS